jgi:hypothetical protein
MKLPHWVTLILGAVVVGLTSLEGQLTGTPALIVRMVVAVSGALGTGLGITSQSALRGPSTAPDPKNEVTKP